MDCEAQTRCCCLYLSYSDPLVSERFKTAITARNKRLTFSGRNTKDYKTKTVLHCAEITDDLIKVQDNCCCRDS